MSTLEREKEISKEEEDMFFRDDVLMMVISTFSDKSAKGVFLTLMRRRIPFLSFDDLPAWKRMRRCVGEDKELSVNIETFLFTLPHLHLDVFLTLLQEVEIEAVEKLFRHAAKQDVPDYIVIILHYLEDLGINYSWYDLFKELQSKDEMLSIRHIMHATGHDAMYFLNVFENSLHQDKEMAEFILASFPCDLDTLHDITSNSSSKKTREAASTLFKERDLEEREEDDLEDPFLNIPPRDPIEWLSERMQHDSALPSEDDEKGMDKATGRALEMVLNLRDGPLNTCIPYLKCHRYGGCRMYTCLCREKKSTWFHRRCDTCEGEIATKYDAYRVPCLDGGWIGCYCHPDCFRTRYQKKVMKRWELIDEMLADKSN